MRFSCFLVESLTAFFRSKSSTIRPSRNLVDWLDFLQGFFGNANFELGTEVSSFSFTHLVLFRVGRPQKPAQFINKALAPFRGAISVLKAFDELSEL
jgi:hypothetical protein